METPISFLLEHCEQFVDLPKASESHRGSQDSGLPNELHPSDSSQLSESDVHDYLFCSDYVDRPPDRISKDKLSVPTDQESQLYHENEYHYVPTKRSSSLKTRRTPPGTPSDKGVRFADAFGLDLATVRTIFNPECPPLVPESATRHLNLTADSDEYMSSGEEEDNPASKSDSPYSSSSSSLSASVYIKRVFQPCFPQPGSNGNFLRRVHEQNVCLETANVDDSGQLHGTIRVRNLAFTKLVTVRITLNNWINYVDVPATYENSCDAGSTDRFAFSYSIPQLGYDDKLQFAISFKTDRAGEEWWDSFFGKNYTFMVMEIVKNGMN